MKHYIGNYVCEYKENPAAYTLIKCCNDIAAANKDYHTRPDYPAAIEHTKSIYNK